MAEPIEGAVAEVLNRRELVLNVGREQGVVKGMRFAVLNSRGAEVKDPTTGEKLGSVNLPKVLVEVVRVQERLAVARTFVVRRRNVGGRGNLALDLFTPARWIEEAETLEIQDRPYLEELDPEQSYVKIGDPVIQVTGDEFLPSDESEQHQE